MGERVVLRGNVLLGHSVGRRFDLCQSGGKREAPPAMAAGVSGRLWEIGDIVKLVEDGEPKPGKRGPYNKRNAN